MRYTIKKMSEDVGLTGHDVVGVSEGTGSSLEISVPYGISIPPIVESTDLQNMRFLKTFVKSIQRALNSSFVKSQLEDQAVGMKHPLAAVRIICDYISYGLLIDFQEEEKLSTTGKMNINRTIQKVVPKFVQNELIFDQYITTKKKIVEENFVARVQASIINHFMDHGGEILFGSKLRVSSTSVKLDSVTENKLRRELGQTYNSRKQNVIRWMIEYIHGLRISKDSAVDGKWNYAIIASTLWECMILSVYGNQIPVNKSKYGKKYSFMSIRTGKPIATGRPTQHDTLYEDDTQVVIIDAKMYGNDTGLLSEEVIGKQFGYYVEAKLQNPQKRIINLLFIPAKTDNGEPEGFADYIITDPHFDAAADPDRIIFLYKCDANKLVYDYYFSQKRYSSLLQSFESFISNQVVRQYLDSRHTY